MAGNGKRKLLIIEDDRDTFRSYTTLLEGDFEIRQCCRRSDVPYMMKFCPDFVMLDLGLADGNGIDAIPVIRRKCPGVPIVVVSGTIADLGDERRILDDPNIVLLPKPFYWEDLERELGIQGGDCSDGGIPEQGGEPPTEANEEAIERQEGAG